MIRMLVMFVIFWGFSMCALWAFRTSQTSDKIKFLKIVLFGGISAIIASAVLGLLVFLF